MNSLSDSSKSVNLTPSERRTLQRVANGETLWGFYPTNGKPEFFFKDDNPANPSRKNDVTSAVNVLMIWGFIYGDHSITDAGRAALAATNAPEARAE